MRFVFNINEYPFFAKHFLTFFNLIMKCEYICHDCCVAGLSQAHRKLQGQPFEHTSQSSGALPMIMACLSINFSDTFLALTQKFLIYPWIQPWTQKPLSLKLWASPYHQHETYTSWRLVLCFKPSVFSPLHLVSLLWHTPYNKARFLSLKIFSALEQIHTQSNFSSQISWGFYENLCQKSCCSWTFHRFNACSC